MLLRNISASLLLVLSISSMANAESNLNPYNGGRENHGVFCPPTCGPAEPAWPGNGSSHGGGGDRDHSGQFPQQPAQPQFPQQPQQPRQPEQPRQPRQPEQPRQPQQPNFPGNRDDRNHGGGGWPDRGGDRGHGGGYGPGHGGPGGGGGWPRPQPPPPPYYPPYQPPRPQPQPPRPQPPRPPAPAPRPPAPRPPQQGYWEYDTQTIYVGRAVQNERFFLREAAGLDGAYRGWEVTSVRAVTSPNSRDTTTVQLIADNSVIAQQVNPGRLINLVPTVSAVLDRNVNSLQLSIIGSTVIVDTIVIELRAYRN